MRDFFSDNPMVDLASLVTIAFFCFFAVVCYRMLRKGRSDRFEHVASLPLQEDDGTVIVRTEKGASR